MADPYEQYYYRQATGAGLPTFRGISIQRGSGLGKLLSAAYRTFAPTIKQVGKAALKEGATAGVRVLGDVLGGQSLGASAKRQLQTGGKRLLGRVLNMSGQPVAKRPARRKKRMGGSRSGGKGKKKGLGRARSQLGGGRGRLKGVLSGVRRKRRGTIRRRVGKKNSSTRQRRVRRRVKRGARDIFSA